jgi:hypothetical protein
MKKFLTSSAIAAAALVSATGAHAQMQSGAELIGQTVDIVFADGTRNSIIFGSGGQARINGTNGASTAATWAVNGADLCLMASGQQECFAYTNRFVAGQAMSMASSCGAASQWMARSVNAPPAPPPPPPPPAPEPEIMAGERG